MNLYVSEMVSLAYEYLRKGNLLHMRCAGLDINIQGPLADRASRSEISLARQESLLALPCPNTYFFPWSCCLLAVGSCNRVGKVNLLLLKIHQRS